MDEAKSDPENSRGIAIEKADQRDPRPAAPRLTRNGCEPGTFPSPSAANRSIHISCTVVKRRKAQDVGIVKGKFTSNGDAPGQRGGTRKTRRTRIGFLNPQPCPPYYKRFVSVSAAQILSRGRRSNIGSHVRARFLFSCQPFSCRLRRHVARRWMARISEEGDGM